MSNSSIWPISTTLAVLARSVDIWARQNILIRESDFPSLNMTLIKICNAWKKRSFTLLHLILVQWFPRNSTTLKNASDSYLSQEDFGIWDIENVMSEIFDSESPTQSVPEMKQDTLLEWIECVRREFAGHTMEGMCQWYVLQKSKWSEKDAQWASNGPGDFEWGFWLPVVNTG